ncbi:MAG: hypothetical protein JOZ05_12680 [Acetobacteraceae bacterium]|nr:hypothetical protein [Acetobacteraceae bacterium]
MRSLGGLVVAGAVSMLLAAAAQEASAQTAAAPVGGPGWTFNLTPYLWMPWLKVDLDYNLPRGLGGRLPTSLTMEPGGIYTNLRFGGTFTAEARYDRFSVLTDFIYLNEGFDFSHTRLRSVDFRGAASQPIRAGAAVSASSVSKTTIWTLAGGYTVLEGDWGNLDAIAGFRYLGVNATTGFTLAAAFTGPLGNSAALGGSSNVSANRDIWNGIGGVRGRIRIPNSYFFIPYYADIGAGGSNLTWQVATGIGYQSGRAGLSAQYRYMSFHEGSSSVVPKVSMSGPMIAVNLTF